MSEERGLRKPFRADGCAAARRILSSIWDDYHALLVPIVLTQEIFGTRYLAPTYMLMHPTAPVTELKDAPLSMELTGDDREGLNRGRM